MPLPLIPVILGAAAVGSGAFGIFKGAKAISDNNEANDINEQARELQDRITKRLRIARNKSKRSLESLGMKKIRVCELPVSRFIALFEQIKNVKFSGSEGLDELAKFSIDKQSFVQLKEINLLATSFAGGAMSGTLAGAAVAFGAYSAAGAFAAASTGTAIAGLSGAAATNATLAFFGGGALAAGGLGVAGGTAVLGGIVAGPALAIVGAVMGAKASANLDNAKSNMATVRKAEEEVNILVAACNGIASRADLFMRVLSRLDLMMFPLLNRLEAIIKDEGVDYSMYKDASKKTIASLLSTMKAVKAILDTPILDANGTLTSESAKVAAVIQRDVLNRTF